MAGAHGKGIEFLDVYKYILKGVSFETGGEGAYALLGPNGSGKTTALKLAAGVIKPERGRVLVGGSNPYRDHGLRGDIVYAANTPQADSFERASRYLEFYYRTTPKERRGSLEDAISYMGLEGLLGNPIYRLSAGQKKRLELSKILLRRARYILADEPTENLDQEGRRRVLELLKRLSKSSLVVLATHEIDLVEELRASVIALRGGSVERVYSYEEFDRVSDKLAVGYSVSCRISLKASSEDPRKALGKYGSSVEVRRFEIDYRSLLKNLGIDIDSLGGAVSVTVRWVSRSELGELPAPTTVISGQGVALPASIEVVVRERALVARVVEDLMSMGDVEELRISRVVGGGG